MPSDPPTRALISMKQHFIYRDQLIASSSSSINGRAIKRMDAREVVHANTEQSSLCAFYDRQAAAASWAPDRLWPEPINALGPCHGQLSPPNHWPHHNFFFIPIQ